MSEFRWGEQDRAELRESGISQHSLNIAKELLTEVIQDFMQNGLPNMGIDEFFRGPVRDRSLNILVEMTFQGSIAGDDVPDVIHALNLLNKYTRTEALYRKSEARFNTELRGLLNE